MSTTWTNRYPDERSAIEPELFRFEPMPDWCPECNASRYGPECDCDEVKWHDDKEDGRSDLHIDTQPGDLDCAGRLLKAGT